MNSHHDPINNEHRRVILLRFERKGFDAVGTFADLEDPGQLHQAVVMRGQAEDLEIGDQCVIRYRGPGRHRGIRWRAGWLFVERADPAHVDQDAEVEALTHA
jgi:hypothetical protein